MVDDSQSPSPAPELDVAEWIGKPSPLESLRGRVVLVETFQMLCPGCIRYGLRRYGLQGTPSMLVIDRAAPLRPPRCRR